MCTIEQHEMRIPEIGFYHDRRIDVNVQDSRKIVSQFSHENEKSGQFQAELKSHHEVKWKTPRHIDFHC